MSQKRSFAALPLNLDEDAIVDQYAEKQGIPDMRKALPAQAPVPRAALAKFGVELPPYAMKALKQKALDEDVSIRHIVMRALTKEGIEIAPVDMVEDGRRRKRD